MRLSGTSDGAHAVSHDRWGLPTALVGLGEGSPAIKFEDIMWDIIEFYGPNITSGAPTNLSSTPSDTTQNANCSNVVFSGPFQTYYAQAVGFGVAFGLLALCVVSGGGYYLYVKVTDGAFQVRLRTPWYRRPSTDPGVPPPALQSSTPSDVETGVETHEDGRHLRCDVPLQAITSANSSSSSPCKYYYFIYN